MFRGVSESKHGVYKVHYLKVDGKGRLDMQQYMELLSDKVAVVSVMWANNESGTLFPVAEMAELARSTGVVFHTNAVQAVGKLPLDLTETSIDMLSLSGHKLHAPKGVGVLYLRRGVRFRPLLRGGHQERGRRAGTENTASIVGLGKAWEMALEHMEYERAFVRAMRDRLEHGILGVVPNCFVTGDPASEHHQHRLRVHRGRGHSAAAQQAGHRGFLRLCLHLGIPRALARHACQGHPVDRGPRHHPLLPVPLQPHG
jgi:cysteine sulfinate desulfinase/cysteine desulfurase-like protein